VAGVRLVVPDSDVFEREVARSLSFLESDFGFARVAIDLGSANSGMAVSATFARPDLTVRTEFDRGVPELFFNVAAPVAWLRAGDSRVLSLGHVLLVVSPTDFHEGPPALAGATLSTAGTCAAVLAWQADMLKRHCAPILAGDFAMLARVRHASVPTVPARQPGSG
jgi:hypothetical protein